MYSSKQELGRRSERPPRHEAGASAFPSATVSITSTGKVSSTATILPNPRDYNTPHQPIHPTYYIPPAPIHARRHSIPRPPCTQTRDSHRYLVRAVSSVRTPLLDDDSSHGPQHGRIFQRCAGAAEAQQRWPGAVDSQLRDCKVLHEKRPAAGKLYVGVEGYSLTARRASI
jgi:hypothetical protein